MIDIDHDKIKDFLQDITLNYDQMTPLQKQLITDFFYSFHFFENQVEMYDKKMLKYLTLGWYIYENLQKTNTNNT